MADSLSPAAWGLLGAWMNICSVWMGLLLAQFTIRRRGLVLVPTPADAQSDVTEWPSVCVVVPACNEASTLRGSMKSVLAQDYPHLTVVIVDDRSQDDTFAIAQQVAKDDLRVRVERVTQLPPGWLGKSHALWHGTRHATADWLLFVDADCTLDPSAVRTTVTEACRRNVELLSLWPRHAARTFWEHMIIPLCGGIIALWFGSQRVNKPTSRMAFANGQFILVRRDVYIRIGGHRSVRRALIEDIPLAEHAKRSGVACWVASGRDLVAVRMYRSYRSIRDGWARIYVGALRSGTKTVLSIAWLLFGSLLPYVVACPLLVRMAGGSMPREWGSFAQITGVLCVFHLAIMMVVSYRFWGLGHCRRADLWLYPVSVVIVMGILLRAWWWLVVRRRVQWRDTHYNIDRTAAIIP